jgi:hypothetical protein
MIMWPRIQTSLFVIARRNWTSLWRRDIEFWQKICL